MRCSSLAMLHTTRVRITLSFDNGPTPCSTDRILDILKARHLKASLFALCRHAAQTQDWSLLVLHDPYLADMMDTLSAFLDEVQRRGGTFTQDFPPSCVLKFQ